MNKDLLFQFVWYVLTDEVYIKNENIHFEYSKIISPYFEINTDNLNFIDSSKEILNVETNPLLRFDNIFNYIVDANYETYDYNLRKSFLNIALHVMGNMDLIEGINKKDVYCLSILRCIKNGTYGKEIKKHFEYFTFKEQMMVSEVVFDSYENYKSIDSFKKIIKLIWNDSIVYDHQYSQNNIIAYINAKKTLQNKNKLNLIKKLFLPIDLELRNFWEYHFGVLGVDETMITGEFSLY